MNVAARLSPSSRDRRRRCPCLLPPPAAAFLHRFFGRCFLLRRSLLGGFLRSSPLHFCRFFGALFGCSFFHSCLLTRRLRRSLLCRSSFHRSLFRRSFLCGS